MPRVIPAVAMVTLLAFAGISCGPSGTPAAGKPRSSAQSPNPVSQQAASQTFTGTVVIKDSASGTSSIDDGFGGGSTTTTIWRASIARAG